MPGPVSTPATDPGFFRGEEEAQPACDWLDATKATGACDATPSYEIWWHPVPELDADTRPVSAACRDHAMTVDRNLVETMRTHRLARSS